MITLTYYHHRLLDSLDIYMEVYYKHRSWCIYITRSKRRVTRQLCHVSMVQTYTSRLGYFGAPL